ncbi:MAG TPA: hypothetical protein VKR61_01210 [Bryobacteraceae bacterium]|nr:hypothetical protein [Bryobacteraceae bacterium]
MKTFALAVLMAFAMHARAEVADSSSSGFTVKITVNIQAAPDEVYRKIIHNVGDWWSSGHTFSGDAHNLSIDEKAMGCFCEKLPNGGVFRHMEVVSLMPGRSIGLTGALGPLQSVAASGNMKFQLEAAEGGATLNFTYAVAGYQPAGMNTWAAPVDSVLKDQLTRLKNYIEHGAAAAK